MGENSWSGELGWRLGAGLAGWAGGLGKKSAEDRSAAGLGWGAGLAAALGGWLRWASGNDRSAGSVPPIKLKKTSYM